MSVRYFYFWLPMIGIAFFNAAIRQLLLVNYLDDTSAHQLSTVTLIIFISIYVSMIFKFLNIRSNKQALMAGLLWLVLTTLFEFALNIFSTGTMERLFQDYNIAAGRIWLLFLLCLFILPYIFHKLQKQ